MHPPPCREPSAGGSIHAFSAQRQGKCRRNGEPRGFAHGRTCCRSRHHRGSGCKRTGAWRTTGESQCVRTCRQRRGRSGLLLHAALALDADKDALLGLVDAQIWNRDKGKVKPRRSRSTADKESQRWLSVAAQAGVALSAARSITVISDRESDIYEHFARRPANVELIVRASWNRKIKIKSGNFAKQFAFVDDLTESGRFSATGQVTSERRRKPFQLARGAMIRRTPE